MTASFTLLVLSSKDRGASSPSILYPKEESGSHCLLILDLKPRSAGLKFGSTIKCLAGEYFNGSDNVLSEMTLSAKRILKEFNNVDYGNSAKRYKLLKQLFGRIGENVCVDIDFHCEYGKHILCGNRVIINMNCTFVDNNIIEIGDDVLIASNVQIYTATHSTRLEERIVRNWQPGKEICHTYAKPVKICNGAWIGGGVIILPGITIGENSVIGAGSIVTHSIPSNCVAVGSPCRVIKTIDNQM